MFILGNTAVMFVYGKVLFAIVCYLPSKLDKLKRLTTAYAVVIACLFSFVALLPAIAENTPDPYLCDSIVIAEYVGWNKKYRNSTPKLISFVSPPVLDYRVIDTLVGEKNTDTKISIQYDFGEWGIEQPKNWKFKTSMLPKIGSKWILFRPMTTCGIGGRLHVDTENTLNGSKGRIEGTTNNIARVKEALCIHDAFQIAVEKFGPEDCTAEVAYTVTRDGLIKNVHLTRGSQNDHFDRLGLERINHVLKKVNYDLEQRGPCIEGNSGDPTMEYTVLISRPTWGQGLQVILQVRDARKGIDYSMSEHLIGAPHLISLAARETSPVPRQSAQFPSSSKSLAFTMKPGPWTPSPPEVQLLQALSRRLHGLIKMRRQELNRQEAESEKVDKRSIAVVVKTIQRELEKVRVYSIYV
jgi:hypothetical protein